MAKAKFDIKSEAVRPFYATVGATDLAVEAARLYVADAQARVNGVQKKVAAFDYEPKRLNKQAQSLVSSRVDTLTKEAKDAQARLETKLAELQDEAKKAQAKFEAQIVELQDEAKALPAKAQARVTEALAEANETYTDLVKRGEKAVAKLRKVELAVDADSKDRTRTRLNSSP